MLLKGCAGTASEARPRFRVKVYAAFEDLPFGYQALFDDVGKTSFPTSLPWFRTFVRTAMQKNAVLRIYGVETAIGGDARGLFVAQSPAARRGAVLRNRHIGSNSVSGLTGYQTPLFGPIVREGDPDLENILLCLSCHLKGERPRWELLDIAAMDADAQSFIEFIGALRGASFIVRPYPHFFSVFQPTAGTSYTSYRDTRPSWARQRISRYERKERQLKKRYAYRVDLITDETGLNQALHDYEAVQALSWKEPDHHPHFVPACITACAEARCLRLMLLHLDDRPVASLFVFLTGRRALFYRTAYDPAYAKESVGAMVHLSMIRHLLDVDHVEELDFGRDREPYKQCWASHERMRYGILAVNCATLGGCLSLAQQLGFEIREWLSRRSSPLRNGLAWFSEHLHRSSNARSRATNHNQDRQE
jgi:hypothetical protein